MKSSKPIGLNEIMIVNPSTKEGARTMIFHPMGQSPESEAVAGYYGQAPYPEMGYYGQAPAEEMGYYGLAPEEMAYYGQGPSEAEMGYYGQAPGEEMGYYGQAPEEVGYYGQAPEAEAMGYYGQYPADYVGEYAQAPEEMGYYGQAPEAGVEGYVREVEPAFNPRGVFTNQLGGYVREKTVNPTCDLTKPAEVMVPPSYPSLFKPHF